MREIGIRELRQHASQYVHAVQAGETITVTDRGTPVAQLTPLSPLEGALAARLRPHGLIAPSRPRRRFAEGRRLTGSPLTPQLDAARAERLA